VYFIFAGVHEFALAQLFEGKPVFGIEVPWPMAWRDAATKGKVSALPKMEQLVAPYVTALRAHSPNAPCVLAGYCFGGKMAVEVAQQFRRQGGNVEMVMLFDASASARRETVLRRLQQTWRDSPSALLPKGLRYLARNLRRLFPFGKPTPIQSGEVLSQIVDERGIAIPWSMVERAAIIIDGNYHPRRLDCRGVLVCSRELAKTQPEPGLGWKDLFAGGLEVIDVAEDHVSIAQTAPNNAGLAQQLSRILEPASQSQMTSADGEVRTTGAVKAQTTGLRPVSTAFS
jgi:thioesterase domain-containing protein